MIQRIQTLWLALSALCMALCFITPAAKYTYFDANLNQTTRAQLELLPKENPAMLDQIAARESVVDFSQKASHFPTWPLIVEALVVIVFAVVSIFLFKNRVRQGNFVMVGFLVNLSYIFMLFFWAVDDYAYAVKGYMHLRDLSVTWALGAYLPIASLAFLFLASRAIRKDEEKVRAADRLR